MLVLDCSLVLSNFLPDEQHPYADSVMQKLATQPQQVVVPTIFYLEVNNVLATAQKRGRISKELYDRTLAEMGLLPLLVDTEAAQFRIAPQLQLLMHRHTLTAYDACYLEVALRRSLPLATLDKTLQKAAIAEGVFYAA
jgi:predicted nucleic acid-binding protein